jgi:DNA-binding NtrC family response regulator
VQAAVNGAPLAIVAGRMQQHTKATQVSDHRSQPSRTNLGDAPSTMTPLASWPIAPARVLVVDDDPTFCEFVNDAVRKLGPAVTWTTTGESALALLDVEHFDVLVADLQMNGIDGLEVCRRALEKRPEMPVLVMTGFGSMESAVAAIRSGATDFVRKPFTMEELAGAIRRAVTSATVNAELKRIRALTDGVRYGMLGTSSAIRGVTDMIERVAGTEATVLITGESGTGKELVARAIHDRSRRANGPLIAINCAAMPETLLESELFGHVKGAFTDARESREGLFVKANGGTLFLDEIGEMPLGMQVKLLRVLQERTVRPIGSATEIPVDTRIVVATNRNLEGEVGAGRFREDLFYRVNVVRVHVPPLRSRGSDVLQLAQFFLERFAQANNKNVVGISHGAATKLLEHTWPGNVRELQNCIERAVAVAAFDHVIATDLPLGEKEKPKEPEEESLVPFDEIERRHVFRVLSAVRGNKTLAAQILGFDRKTLYRKLHQYEAQSRAATPPPTPEGAGAASSGTP